MKSTVVFLVSLFGAFAAPAFATQDAAQKAQEGHIDHWIEYYSKQRAIGNDPVTGQAAPGEAQPADAGGADPGAPATPQPSTVRPDD